MLIPLHNVRDEQRLASLIESIAANGWSGAPLVKWGDHNLITGSHRYAACKALEWEDRDIPTIDIEDIYAEAGLDFDTLHADHDSPTISDWYDLVRLLNELPQAIRDKYGIDAE